MEVSPLISPTQLALEKEQESVVIIDTRAPEEYAISHIPSAVNIREIFTYLTNSTPEALLGLQSLFSEILA